MAQRHLVIIFLDQNVCIRSWQAISCPSALHVARSYPSGTASVGSVYHFSKGYPNPPESILASPKELQLRCECPPSSLQLSVAVTQLTKGTQAEIMCAASRSVFYRVCPLSLYLPPYCCLSLDMLSPQASACHGINLQEDVFLELFICPSSVNKLFSSTDSTLYPPPQFFKTGFSV